MLRSHPLRAARLGGAPRPRSCLRRGGGCTIAPGTHQQARRSARSEGRTPGARHGGKKGGRERPAGAGTGPAADDVSDRSHEEAHVPARGEPPPRQQIADNLTLAQVRQSALRACTADEGRKGQQGPRAGPQQVNWRPPHRRDGGKDQGAGRKGRTRGWREVPRGPGWVARAPCCGGSAGGAGGAAEPLDAEVLT